ncbi:uncharacterized protein F5147DRAFT_681746 [Suillus discolor]|uniref:Mid2 domain-containing protein n=1 Tax=Suillus discolor TaxID=1912936 RepID=A0A9P7FEE1_9AGAM|nr:uncharacterized protein F5147DRAFT_681746 [Suillus discolor]KAG2113567.1 hypothetical protein F5147DRAFT_681746 [Suillus discolor]
MQRLAWVAPLLLYHAVVVLAAGNTTCLSSQLDWYTTAVGETPCTTYQRLRQICNSAYLVGNFNPTTPGDRCDDQVSDCCCNSVAFVLSMLCMNCQEDAVAGNVAGIDAAPGTYTTYLATCGTSTNYSLPVDIQQAVCNENIKIDNFIYNRTFWSDGSCRWTADYAVEQQAINNNNTFTVCPNQVSPSASLPTSTTAPTAGGSPTITSIFSAALHSSSGNANSAASSTSTSRTAIIGGAVGGAALAIIAVLGGVYCYRRSKRPRMIQDTPSVFLGQSYGVQPVYGASFTDAEPVATQRYSSSSPVRRHHESRESSLPVVHSLSPERVQSLNPSIGPSYLGNDDFSEVVPYIREDDAGTLIPPHDAPAERLPPAYNSSWVSRNARPSNSDPGEDQVLLDQTVQTVWPNDETRRESTTGVPQEKIASRWSSDS